MSWLENLTNDQIKNGKLPLNEILENSFYYPSCGFDGGIVKDCNTENRALGIKSFIYCDYATGETAFKEEQNTFIGYHIVGSRSVAPSEIIPNGWLRVNPPKFNLRAYYQYKDMWEPFAHWTIFERDENRTEDHGPKRFSLLYIGGEGVATYQALYWTNKKTPIALAIIQPGTSFGLNWTDFRKKDGPLSWVVNKNPAGQPNYIYYGGVGRDYSDFDWTGYEEVRKICPYYRVGGLVNVWEKFS
jgi:hypothetical protein